ncbi:MAG: MFS transporter [Rhizobium sp.]|nr:MAG: MFS transporter [Rhizobium sp.]
MTVVSISSASTATFSKLTLTALVAFAAITPMALLVAPALAAQLGFELRLGPPQVGTYFFVENGAFSAASLASLVWLGRANVRVIGASALAVFAIGNLVTPFVLPDYTSLLFVRAFAGFGGGTLMVLSMVSGQDAENPDRVFGYWVVGQLVAGAAGLFLLPYLFASFGLKSFYIALGVLTLLMSPLCKGFVVPISSRHAVSVHPVPPRVVLFAAMAIIAILAFYIVIGGVWTFASAAAAQNGIQNEATGGILAVASLFGIAGAMLATCLGGHLGRRSMLILGYAILLLAVLGLAVFAGRMGYIAAICSFKFGWTFVLPFIIAEVASRDPSGRLVASTTLIIGSGLSLGPLFAGMLLGSAWSLSAVFIAAAVIALLSFVCLSISPRLQAAG